MSKLNVLSLCLLYFSTLNMLNLTCCCACCPPSHPCTGLSFHPSPQLLQLFKEELTQVKEGMKHVNDLAHQLAISDVHLSMENARALEHLNSRWKVLQVE